MPHHPFSVAAHWNGDFQETALQTWAEELRASLQSPSVSLGLVFIGPKLLEQSRQILEILRVHAQVPLLVGCSSASLIAGGEEHEQNPGITLGLYFLPGAQLEAFHFTQEHLDEANGPGYWHLETAIDPSAVNGWLAFADPFNFDCDTWLREWNQAYPSLPVVGGLASGDYASRSTQVFLNGEVHSEGVVVVGVSGGVAIASVISQGCTPIGETWTITKTDQNLIYQIANRPAYEVLLETFGKLSSEDQKKCQGNLFIGLVVNEYLEEFHRGDFLIRNLLGVDPNSGVIAVGALPRAGQTMQFQRRDAAAANEDMAALLNRAHEKLKKSTVFGGLLCSCNGRGSGLFGYPHHDAAMIQRRLGPLGLTGFFCNGEIGPIGDKNFLHGYTASLGLFVKVETNE